MTQSARKPNQPRPEPKPGILSIKAYEAGKSKAETAKKIIKLSSNETPLGPSPKAMAAYVNAAATLHRYPDSGHSALREAIAEVHGLEAERIICGSGSDELIGMLVHAYAGAGDEVLYSEHGFLMYKIYTQGFGATPVTAPETNLTADVDALLAKVTKHTKLLFLANPNNPTGSYLSASDMKRLHAGLPGDVILVIDAAYAEYVEAADYSGGAELVRQFENVVMLRTFSKIYGLPALRLGWAYGPAPIIDVLNRIRGPFNVGAPALAAGIEAVRDTSFTEAAKAFNTRWLAWLSDEVRKLGLKVYPSAGNFILIEFSASGKHTAKAANEFLMKEGIIPREVSNYGLPNALRVSIGLEAENQAFVDALRAFLQR